VPGPAANETPLPLSVKRETIACDRLHSGKLFTEPLLLVLTVTNQQ